MYRVKVRSVSMYISSPQYCTHMAGIHREQCLNKSQDVINEVLKP